MTLYSRTVEGIYVCAGNLTTNNAWQIFCETRDTERLNLAELEFVQWKRVKDLRL